MSFGGIYGSLGEDEAIELRMLGGQRPGRVFCRSLEDASGKALAAMERCNVYFGVAVRDGKGGRKENVVRVNAVWADLDLKDVGEPPQEKLKRSPLAPSAVVCSGSGQHCYWFLKEPVWKEGFGLVEFINSEIAGVIGGDSVQDVTRVLRVPGTYNHKRGKMQPVLLADIDPSRRYSLSDLMLAFCSPKPKQESNSMPEKSEAPRSDSSLPCRSEMWKGVAEGRRNNAMFWLVNDLKKNGIGAAEAKAAVFKWNARNRPPIQPKEFNTTFSSAWRGGYPGLGCEKEPMKSLCSKDCPVKKKQNANQSIESEPLAAESPAPNLITLGELLKRDMEPPRFVVENLVPREGLTLMVGDGSVGKSFLVQEAALAVSLGEKFLGRFECEQGPVLVLDLENRLFLLRHRLMKMVRGREIEPEKAASLKVHYMDEQDLVTKGISHANLHLDNSHGRGVIRRYLEQIRPVLLILDSMIAFHSSDENDNVAMRSIASYLSGLAVEFDMAVLMLHHSRKLGQNNEASQMMRGASDLRNAADSYLFIRRISKDTIIIDPDKTRAIEKPDKFTVEFADDETGTATTLRYAGETTQSAEKSARAREVILAVLEESGSCKRIELIGRLASEGIKHATVDKLLRQLIVENRIERSAPGIYTLSTSQLCVGF